MSFLQWLENSGFGQLIESSTWTNLILLCFHAVGMSIVVGVLWLFDLRVLGFTKGVPLATFKPLMRLAWWGFIVNAVSGVLMFIGGATRFIINTDFQLKMLLIVLGGLSALAIHRSVGLVAEEAETLIVPPAVKIVAAFSLLIWLGVIIFGRQIAYTLARPAS